MPSKPLELDQVGISFPKEMIHGNIPWPNAYIDEDSTIDAIVCAMTPTKVVFHIFQQRPKEGTANFEAHHQAIMNISKDINVVKNKVQMPK
jgi:hypothetical protein